MKKILFVVLICGGLFRSSFSQFSPAQISDLKKQLSTANYDSTRMNLLSQLAIGYRFSNIDSSLLYSDSPLGFANKLKLPAVKAQLLSLKGATLLEAGKLPESLQFQFEALRLSEELKDTITKAFALNRIGNTYMELADYGKANDYYFRSKDFFHEVGNTGMYHNEVSNIGNIYELLKMPDSALYYQQIVYDATLKTNDRHNYTRSEIMFRMGNAYKLKGNIEKALAYYKRGVVESYVDNDVRDLTMNNLLIAKLYYELSMPDSSMKYAYNAVETGKAVSFRKGVYDASVLLSGLFKEKNKYDSAFKYLSAATTERDSLTGTKRFQELQRIILDEQERQREAEAKRIAMQNRQKQYALLAGLGIFLIVASILYRNNKQKQKTNKIFNNFLRNYIL